MTIRLESDKMSMNIRGNSDYSILFSSLSTKQNASATFFGSAGNMSDLTTSVLGGGNSSGGVNLGDYAAIKNGSYKKLLKSYFNMKKEQEKVTTEDNKEENKKTDATKEESAVEKLVGTTKTDKTDSVLTTSWDDIVAEANAKTDAMYSELGKKTNTTSSGSYLDTLI